MKTVYLIRHGKPDFPENKRMCLGITDLPMGDEGFLQAKAAAEILKDREFKLFSSPLIRAIQTAEAFKRPITVLDGLRELDAGLWDGLYFDEIKLRYPELYAARGKDKTLPLPGGEDHEAGIERFNNALLRAVSMSEGDAAVVAHAGIIGLFLEKICGEYKKPEYCEVLQLRYENNKFSFIGGINHA